MPEKKEIPKYSDADLAMWVQFACALVSSDVDDELGFDEIGQIADGCVAETMKRRA